MRLAIMQPYFFPYLGYFQLMRAVDRFVFYDDVDFIKNGWINRNRILDQGQAKYITVPLRGASSFEKINRTDYDAQGARWKRKMLGQLGNAYAGAPNRAAVLELVESVITEPQPSVGHLAKASVRAVLDYLGLDAEIVDSSAEYGNDDLAGQDRVLDICRREQADTYINVSGGMALYQSAAFADCGVELQFLRARLSRYSQPTTEFVAGLSILDALMQCDRKQIAEICADGEIVESEMHSEIATASLVQSPLER